MEEIITPELSVAFIFSQLEKLNFDHNNIIQIAELADLLKLNKDVVQRIYSILKISSELDSINPIDFGGIQQRLNKVSFRGVVLDTISNSHRGFEISDKIFITDIAVLTNDLRVKYARKLAGELGFNELLKRRFKSKALSPETKFLLSIALLLDYRKEIEEYIKKNEHKDDYNVIKLAYN